MKNLIIGTQVATLTEYNSFLGTGSLWGVESYSNYQEIPTFHVT
jgi:hypothetical protein